MLINKSILKNDFEPLEAGNTVREAMYRMEEEDVEMLPVVDATTQKLIGQLTHDQLQKADGDAKISELEVDDIVKIYLGQHIFEAVRLMLQFELWMLPLVDKEMTFLGAVTRQRVLESISRMLNLAEEGSILTVEMDPLDFSISEIVQIIETEGAKILGLTVENPTSDRQKFTVSVKLNLKDLSRVTAALKRYDYTVITESESTVYGDDLEHRADELLKYIDM